MGGSGDNGPTRTVAWLVGGLAAAGVVAWLRRRGQSGSADRLPLPQGTALITGASSGIGEAYARRLAALGYDLILVARREAKLATLAAELSERHGVSAAVLAADLAEAADVQRVVERIEQTSDLVLLINNAGFGTRGYFADVAVDRHLEMIDVHVVATVRLTHAALPGMTSRGAGAIINVSSIAAFFAAPGGATYGATKIYLNTFSEAVALETREAGLKVQALCPGFTYSEFHDTPEYDNFNRSELPDRMWMTSEAVVDESLTALRGDEVIVIPGGQNRAMVAATRLPGGGLIRSAGRRVVAYLRRNGRFGGPPRARDRNGQADSPLAFAPAASTSTTKETQTT